MSGRLRVLFLAERYRALDEDRLLADGRTAAEAEEMLAEGFGR